jgi:hypothetical protein
MKKLIVLSLLCLTTFVNAQDAIKKTSKDSTLTFTGVSGLNFSQVALSNWNGGGNNALSIATLLDLNLKKKTAKYSWTNSLSMAYGLQKIEDQDFRKTDDKIEFVSEYKTKAFKKWDYVGNFTFRSQFDKGYTYPTDSTRNLISEFLAPGYFNFSIGLNRQIGKVFNVSISPVAGKITVVGNDSLASIGAFGVDEGKNVRAEFGGSAKLGVNWEVMKNVTYKSTLELFSNYANNPGNIDVNWDNLLAIKANKHITTTLSVTMLYDDDIKISGDDNGDGIIDFNGPRVQLKQVFNLGIQYKF